MENEPVKEEGQALADAMNPALTGAKEANKIALKWFEEFKVKPISLIAFIAVGIILIMGYFIKESFRGQVEDLKATVASQSREIFVKDSIHQVRLDAANYNWQGRYDRVDSALKVSLVLLGAKKALENR